MHQRLAIVADPHLHNVTGNYRGDRIPAERLPGGMELRTLADTVQSTRLFNESEANFRAVLYDIAARGVRHVIVVGDYSDDGQDESVAASLALMRSCDRGGIHFDPMDTTYFASRETVIATRHGGMPIWRDRLFAVMHRNAAPASGFFRIPGNRLVELGAQVEI